MTIKEVYEQKCATQSDINELLPYLKEYAEKVETVTEFGVRNPTSTYALMVAFPKKLVSYDIARYPQVDEAELLAKGEGVDFEFILGSTLEVEIEPTDFLWIDTYHTYTQLKRELVRHADKVKKYIGFHDTTTYELCGETPYEGILSEVACGQGLWPAIQELLNTGAWKIAFRTTINNGLTIIERV